MCGGLQAGGVCGCRLAFWGLQACGKARRLRSWGAGAEGCWRQATMQRLTGCLLCRLFDSDDEPPSQSCKRRLTLPRPRSAQRTTGSHAAQLHNTQIQLLDAKGLKRIVTAFEKKVGAVWEGAGVVLCAMRS